MTISTISISFIFTDLWQGHPDDIPDIPGLYIIITVKALYVGRTKSLPQRIPQSQNERSLREAVVYYFPLHPTLLPLISEHLELLKRAEALLISAMFTLIFGNRAPVFLLNKQHARSLPDCAWQAHVPDDVAFALRIARTILRDVGLAFKLPSLKEIRQRRAVLDAAIERQDWPFLIRDDEQRRATRCDPDIIGLKSMLVKKVRLLPRQKPPKAGFN